MKFQEVGFNKILFESFFFKKKQGTICVTRNLSLATNLARVDSSSPLCWSQAQEKREGWKPHFCKTTHTQNPQRNTTHRHQPRNSDLFKFFRGRTPGLIAWAVAMNKPG
nr:unnamed protein product [Callosobruchus chinensis]